MAQVFLSYAREDEERVENLYQELSEEGFKPWMDKKDILPGENWPSSIQRAIRRSDFFLACLSANSVSKRGFLQREIKDALDIWQEMLDSDIYLIPVRLENCEVPESLHKLQWVNLFEEDGWTRLMKAIQVGIERRNEDTPRATAVQVAVVLDSDIQEFTPVEQESFFFALSGIVNINPDQIRILRVAPRSIPVMLEMPEEAAQLLVSMCLAKDPVLQTLHIAEADLRPVTASPGISRQEVEPGVPHPAKRLLGRIALVAAPVIVGAAIFLAFRGPEPPPLARVVRTVSEIHVDGLLNEPAWSEGDSLTYAVHPAKNGSTTATVHFLWDDDHLYAGFDVNDTQVEMADLSTLWDSDSVSLLLHDSGIAEHRQSLGEELGDYRAVQLKPMTTLNEPADADNGYTVEMRIKWRQPPLLGRRIRADLLSVDHDANPGAKADAPGTVFSKLSWDGDGDITSAGASLLLVAGKH